MNAHKIFVAGAADPEIRTRMNLARQSHNQKNFYHGDTETRSFATEITEVTEMLGRIYGIVVIPSRGERRSEKCRKIRGRGFG